MRAEGTELVSGISYLDFDLKIEREGTRYRALVMSSPAGQAAQVFDCPFSDLEVENFLLRMGRPRRGVRRADSPEVTAVKKFGGDLFGATFREEVLVCLRASMNEATRQNAGLRIRLHLTEVPELADLPWEFLYYQAMNRFLVLSDVTPVVRYLDLPEGIRPYAIQPPLRVLVMISSPSDYPELEVEKEWNNLHGALEELEKKGLVLLQRLEQATPAALRRRLRQEEFHVLHFIGHGGFDANSQDGTLVLEDEEKRGRRMSGADLGMILHDHRPMRLAVLNACEGARASRSDPFGGTAQSLVQQGIPAVIAMQFEITDLAAITFAQEFYAAIADNYPADAALAEARKAICDEGYIPEWGTPVLYLRARDGRLFDVQTMSEEDRNKAQASALLAAAEKAASAESWPTAAEKLEEVMKLQPTNAEAQDKLREVRRLQQADEQYQRGCDAAQAGRWREALESFRQAREAGGSFKAVIEERIREAQAALEKEATAQAARAAAHPAVSPSAAYQPPVPVSWTPPTAAPKGSTGKWFLAGAGGAVAVVILIAIGMAMRPGPQTNNNGGAGGGTLSTPAQNTSSSGGSGSGSGATANEPNPNQEHGLAPSSTTPSRKDPRTPTRTRDMPTGDGRVATSDPNYVPPASPVLPIEDQLLQRYVEGRGGRAAISAVNCWLATGTYTMSPMNISGRYTAVARAPNKSVEEFTLPTGGFIRDGYDGSVAWTSNPKDGVRQLFGQEAEEAAISADFYGDLNLRTRFPTIRYLGEQQVNGRGVDVIELTSRSGLKRTVYLDKLNSLLLRTDEEQVGPEGNTAVQAYFEDYREIDGIRLPFRVRQVSPQFTIVIQIFQMRHNVPLNDSLFLKPYTP